MTMNAFEAGFKKEAAGILAPLLKGVGQFGKNLGSASVKAPKFMQGAVKSTGNWIAKNPGKATGAVGGLALGGAGVAGAKMLGMGRPSQSQVVNVKTAFELGFAKQASNFGHAAEIAGLGILAGPSISEIQGKEWNPKAKAGAEIAGLGVLAVPSAAHFLSKSKKLAPYLKHLV